MDLDVLKVKFTHSNTVRDKKPYTIYEIEVRSSSTITWVIYKRYSSFHDVHVALMKSTQISPEQKIHLPQLPPKRLTRSLAVEFVEKRKNELQDYLRALLETPGLVHSPIILEFLEVPDSVRPMLAAAMQHGSQLAGGPFGAHMAGAGGGLGGFSDLGAKDYSADPSSSASSKQSYASKTPDERRILELIKLLKYHPNKVTAIKSFEEWFFDSRPRLSPEFIKLLLQGQSGSDTDAGLMQTIGNITYSHVASRAALYLLCRLLDVEKNKDAHLFLEQFGALDTQILKMMQINQHIISERGNRIGAFKIIQILRNANVGSNVGGRPDFMLEQIVNDSWALREYYKWAERKSDTSGQIVPFNHLTTQNKDSIVLNSLNLSAASASASAGQTPPAKAEGGPFVDTDVGQMRHLRSKISDILQDLKGLMEERETLVCGVDGQVMTAALATTQPQSAGGSAWRVVGLVPPFDTQGRPLVSGVESLDEDVSILYRHSPKQQEVVAVKMVCIMPYRMEEVAPYLADLRRRKEWDLKFHKGKCLEQRQSQEYAAPASASAHPVPLQYPAYETDIVHMIFKSFSSPYKYRDVVVVRSFAQIDLTRAEFEAQGFKSRQNIAGAPQQEEKSQGGGMDGGAQKETEEPIFKEGIFADGGMMFGTRSVIHAAGPEFKDNVRAVLYPTGYILTPLRDQGIDIHPSSPSAGAPTFSNEFGSSCKLTFLSQMDRESVLIVSPDLLGETNELRQTFNNIKACLARDFGLRTLRSSPHTQAVRLQSGRPEVASQQPRPSGAGPLDPSGSASNSPRMPSVAERR